MTEELTKDARDALPHMGAYGRAALSVIDALTRERDEALECQEETKALRAEVERQSALLTLRDATERENAKLCAEVERLRAEHAELSALHTHSVGFWEPQLVSMRARLAAATELLKRALNKDPLARRDIRAHLAAQPAAPEEKDAYDSAPCLLGSGNGQPAAPARTEAEHMRPSFPLQSLGDDERELDERPRRQKADAVEQPDKDRGR